MLKPTISTTGATLRRLKPGSDRFVERVPEHGVVIACADDPGSERIAKAASETGRRVVQYGASESADMRITEVALDATGAWFQPVLKGRKLPDVSLKVLGMHNVLNAAAALSVALEVGVGVPDAIEGLALYSGARRRFEFKGEVNGVRVYDDYAHHHSELRATLTAARQIVGWTHHRGVPTASLHANRTVLPRAGRGPWAWQTGCW